MPLGFVKCGHCTTPTLCEHRAYCMRSLREDKRSVTAQMVSQDVAVARTGYNVPEPPPNVLTGLGDFTAGKAARTGYNVPEPSPRPNPGEPAVWDLVIADIANRDAAGAVKYGQRLTAGDGRDSLVDAYQEALDLVVYLRKALRERELVLQARPEWLDTYLDLAADDAEESQKEIAAYIRKLEMTIPQGRE